MDVVVVVVVVIVVVVVVVVAVVVVRTRMKMHVLCSNHAVCHLSIHKKLWMQLWPGYASYLTQIGCVDYP